MSATISAGELRERGIPVPERIPDEAVIPVGSYRMEVGDVVAGEGGRVSAEINVFFDAPFEWAEVSGTVER